MLGSGYFGGTMGASLNGPSFRNIMDSRWNTIYPAAFFDPLAMQTVMDPKILIQWSRFFYDWHPVVHAAIQGMAEYPITDFIFDTDNSQVRQNYEDVFNKIDLRGTLISMSLSYFISGECYATVLMPFTRFLKCPKCGTEYTVDAAKIAKGTGSGFRINCEKCIETVTPLVKDTTTQDPKGIRIISWNPLNITVEHDEITNTSEIYYSIPPKVKDRIVKGEKEALKKYPMVIIQAALSNKMVKLAPEKLICMRRPAHSATYLKGRGQPLITPVLKWLFHSLLLIRGQDALAMDQILPWTILSPSSNAGVDPAGETNLSEWKDQIMSEYDRWKKNPLNKSIMPIPVNAQIVGANGKGLMLNPEIEAANNQILAGMGVPNEFVFGGLQWSGASVSLRMLENKFINHRTMLQRIIDYFVEAIHIHFGYPNIKVRMQSFKMADDVAQKQTLINLAMDKTISKRTLLEEIMPDVDLEDEFERIKQEELEALKIQQELQRASVAAGIVMPGAEGGGGDASSGTPQALPENGPPRAEGANQQI